METSEIAKKYIENINEKVKEGNISFFAREKLIDNSIKVLSKFYRNNLLLIGGAGVGKSTIIYGIAKKINDGEVPKNLRKKEIYKLNFTSLMANASLQGQLESRLKFIVDFIQKNSAILFVDEIYFMPKEMTVLLKNLSGGDGEEKKIQFIGATTKSEYIKTFKDEAFKRRFSVLEVLPTDPSETLTIIKNLKEKFENYYNLKITNEALISVVKLSEKFIQEDNFPDKAINLLDSACAKTKFNEVLGLNLKKKIIELKKIESEKFYKDFQLIEEIAREEKNLEIFEKESSLISKILEKKKQLKEKKMLTNSSFIDNFNWENISKITNFEIPELEKEIKELENKAKKNHLINYFVDEESVYQVISDLYNMKISKEKQESGFFLQESLSRKIKGQKEAIEKISTVLFPSYAGISNQKKPFASFIFAGPTGVGKTETAIALAQEVFYGKINRINLSEFSEEHSVSKLLGSPPGYVGFENQISIFENMGSASQVILFDEAEKCHPNVLFLFLQILDYGSLTLSNGKEINFKNCIIILTTNLGSELFVKNVPNFEERLYRILKSKFSPEFMNRIDEIIYFNDLSFQALREVVIKELDDYFRNIKELKGIEFEYSKKIVEKIFEISCVNGARGIKKTIERKISFKLAKFLITNFFSKGNKFFLDFDEKEQIVARQLHNLIDSKDKKE